MTDKKQSPQKRLHIHRLKKPPGEYFAQLNQIKCKERHFPQLAMYNHHHITFFLLADVHISLACFQ